MVRMLSPVMRLKEMVRSWQDQKLAKESEENLRLMFQKESSKNEVLARDICDRLTELESTHKGYIMNPNSVHKTVHKPRASCSVYDPNTQISICGWRYGLSKYVPTSKLPTNYKSICGSCLQEDREFCKQISLQEDEHNISSSSSSSSGQSDEE